MSSLDIEYYRERAIAETEQAFAATDEVVARLHAELALHYQSLLAKAEGRVWSEGPAPRPAPSRRFLGVHWNGMGRARTD